MVKQAAAAVMALALLAGCKNDRDRDTGALDNARSGVDTVVNASTVRDTTVIRADTNINVDTLKNTDHIKNDEKK